MNVTDLRAALAKLESEGKGSWPVTTNEAARTFGEVLVVSERSGAIALLQNSAIAPTVSAQADPVIVATGTGLPAWDLRGEPEPPSPLDGLMPLPCPDCGSVAHGALDKSGGAYWVRCLKCPTGTFAPTAAEAIAQWNASGNRGKPGA